MSSFSPPVRWIVLVSNPSPRARRWAGAAVVALIAVIGTADYLTGFQISLLPFYFLPVCLATAVFGRGPGIGMAVVSVGTWIAADFAAGARYANPLIVVWNALIALAVCLVVVWLLSSLLEAHRGMEARVRERTAALTEEIAERERLERAVLTIGERERLGIGRDLHDGLGQHLTGTALMAQALGARLEARGAAEAAEARKIISLVEQGIEQTRRLAKGLLLAEIEPEGLATALEEFAATSAQNFQIDCRVRCEAAVTLPGGETATHLLRIAQEAIRNAARHGRAKRVEVELSASPAGLILEITDDGVGLPPGAASKGLGLRIMAHRASLIGATLAVDARPGGGTRVECRLPLTL